MYMPYNTASTNALAYAASWQIFFTYTAAFLLVTEPLPFSPSGLSVVLLIANLVIFGLAIYQQKQVALKQLEAIELRAKVNDTHRLTHAHTLHLTHTHIHEGQCAAVTDS